MTPAPDNKEVGYYELYKYELNWYVRFLDQKSQPMKTNLLYIGKSAYENVSNTQPQEYVLLINPLTAWGAKRIVNKFLKGQTPLKPNPKLIKKDIITTG